MRTLFYVLTVVIFIGWAVGFFGYSAGGSVHILLITAIVTFSLAVIPEKKV
ncbi:MAG: lmo0937 family membrane protein [Bacteroidia bacterium]